MPRCVPRFNVKPTSVLVALVSYARLGLDAYRYVAIMLLLMEYLASWKLGFD
jgi:hypothetical protein